MVVLVFPVALLTGLLVSILLSAPRAHPDVAMYLQAAELLLEGERPYVDFVDLNPPLVFYLNTLPVALARLLGAHPMRVFALVIALLVAWSAGSSHASVARAGGREGSLAAGGIAASIVGLSLWLWLEGDYGQREHVVFLLYLPYLCARSVGRDRDAGRFVRGFAAGLGICLKPQFVGLAALVELYFLVLRREPRRLPAGDLAGLIVAVLAYGAHFTLLPGDVREAFFERWLPMVLRGYVAYEAPLASVWIRGFDAALILAGTSLLLRVCARGALAELVGALGLACAVSVAIVVAQSKGWFYHRIPVLGFGLGAAAGLTAWAIARAERRAGARAWAGDAAALAAACAVFAGAVLGLTSRVHFVYPEPADPLRSFVQRFTREGNPVLVCSIHVAPAYPLLTEQNRRPGSRFLWLFPLGMFLKAPPTAEAAAWVAAEEPRILGELARDIAASRPALVILPGIGLDPNLNAYLRRRGVLAAFGDYEQVAAVEGWKILAPRRN
jgi:hypothetical protein